MPQKDTLYGDLFVIGNLEANLIKKTGGTSSQFLKADGSVDSSTYLSSVPTLDQVTTAGNTTTNAINTGLITTTTSAVGNMFVANGVNNTGLTLLNDSSGRSFLTVKGNLSATSNAGAYFTAEGYQEAWFNVVARSAIAGNQYWRFGNIGAGTVNNVFAIQKLNDAATTITFTALAIASSTGNVGINTTTDAGYKLDVNGTFRTQGATILGGSSTVTMLNTNNGFTFGDVYLQGKNSAVTFLYTNWLQFLITPNTTIGAQIASSAKLQVTGSITAATALAQGVYFNNTLVAAANNDVLVGLDINPTFTNGAFTGVTNYALRTTGRQLLKATVDGFESIKLQNFADTYFNTISFYKSNGTSQTVVLGDNGASVAYPFMTGMLANYGFAGNKNSGFHIFAGSNITQTIHTNGNVGIGTTTDSGQKLQISGSIFIKGTTSLTATKIFEVQNGSGTSIMDFRDNQYAFFGCGQGGGSASGFIFNYSNTSYTQFAGYNYGAGSGSYKPILMDTDGGGRNQGIFVNFGVSTNTPPNSDTEFAVRGRTSDATTYIARFRNSGNTDSFAIRADGALFVGGSQGYTGTVNFPMNPPGQQNIDIVNGMIVNVF